MSAVEAYLTILFFNMDRLRNLSLAKRNLRKGLRIERRKGALCQLRENPNEHLMKIKLGGNIILGKLSRGEGRLANKDAETG